MRHVGPTSAICCCRLPVACRMVLAAFTGAASPTDTPVPADAARPRPAAAPPAPAMGRSSDECVSVRIASVVNAFALLGLDIGPERTGGDSDQIDADASVPGLAGARNGGPSGDVSVDPIK